MSDKRRYPVLLCDDGSEGAREAFVVAGQLLAGRDAVVLTVVESLSPAVFYGVGGDATSPSGGGVPLHVDRSKQLDDSSPRVSRRLGRPGSTRSRSSTSLRTRPHCGSPGSQTSTKRRSSWSAPGASRS